MTTNFSLSSKEGHKAGRILLAQSSSLNRSEVAASANKAAFRAWTNGSRNERAKAATSTFCLVYDPVSSCNSEINQWIHTLAPRFRAILPRQIVVFVRIPGCSSFDVFARYFSNSPLIVRSDNFVMIVRTALTVCSRTKGAASVKPETYTYQQCPPDQIPWTYQLREDLVIDDLLRQVIYHVW